MKEKIIKKEAHQKDTEDFVEIMKLYDQMDKKSKNQCVICKKPSGEK